METIHEWHEPWKLAVEDHSMLRAVHEKLREQISQKWKRSLPFADELFDRWERANYLGFGEGTSVYDSVVIIGEVRVGKNVWVGPNVMLDGSGGLEIGDHCTLATGVQIYSHDTVQYCVTGGKAAIAHEPTRIADCTYVGAMSVVDKGVSIGSHCVVGAHAFVHRNIPDHSIAVGCPAKIVGRVELSKNGESAELIYT